MDKDNGEKDPSSDERPPYDFLNRKRKEECLIQ